MKRPWDDELPAELQVEWLKLTELLSNDDCLKVKRYYFDDFKLGEIRTFTLHGFCDASEMGLAAVIYIVGEIQGERKSGFVASKTKVAPLRKISMPKMELCACEMLSNLMVNIIKALDGVVQEVRKICWSDSLDALFWIKNESRRRQVYIERRVQKIRKNIPAIGWRHCPTKLNAADIASRGMKTTRKVESEFQNWIMGPHFIRKDSAEWPVDISNNDKMDEKEEVTINCSYETKHKVLCMYVMDDVTNKVTQNIKIFQEKVPIDKIVDIERFSFLQKLLRTTAWVLRYINNL